MTNEKLSKVIASAGFYTRKTQTIKDVATYFEENFACILELAQEQNKKKLRKEILSIHGISPETVDVILMYGPRKGEFVVDTYSRRLFNCLGWKNISS